MPREVEHYVVVFMGFELRTTCVLNAVGSGAYVHHMCVNLLLKSMLVRLFYSRNETEETADPLPSLPCHPIVVPNASREKGDTLRYHYYYY